MKKERQVTSKDRNKTRRRVALLNTVLFGGLVVALFLCLAILPKETFSEKENRQLAAFPKVTAESILSGDAMDEAESYVDDHFAFRETFIPMRAVLQRLSGRADNNGVYYGDQLIQTFWTYDKEQLTKNLVSVERYAEGCKAAGEAVYFVPVPNAVAVAEDRLPAGAPDVPQAGLLRIIENDASSAHVVNALPALQEHEKTLQARAQRNAGTDSTSTTGTDVANSESKADSCYYRTDHHMTQQGAYVVYRELLAAMGMIPLAITDFDIEQVSEDFTGTLVSKSGVFWTQPEPIEKWTRKEETNKEKQKAQGLAEEGVKSDVAADKDSDAGDVTLTILPSGETHDTLYNEAALTQADKYQYYAFGNQPLEVIKTGADGGRILLVKDSYAHALIPFLATAFSEIHMVDLRYYHGSLAEYKKENGLTTTVILYNIANFTEDTDLSKLTL